MASSKGFYGSGFGLAQTLLHLGPDLFDGIEVGGVGGQVHEACSARFNLLLYSLHLDREVSMFMPTGKAPRQMSRMEHLRKLVGAGARQR
jgi:hypothetical protein